MLANTDTKFYLPLSSNVYRFLPLPLTTSDLYTIHGHDERIGVFAFINAVRFYHHLILAADIQVPLKTQPGHRAGEL